MKPGVKTLIFGALFFVIGGFALPALFISLLIFNDKDAFQFKVPGQVETEVKELGRHHLWNDYQTIYEGRSYSKPQNVPDGMEIQIVDAAGEKLKFFGDTSMSSKMAGSSKVSIGYVEIVQPGKITIQVSGGNEERIFSFSQSIFSKGLGRFVGVIFVSTLFGFTGFGFIIWGVVKLLKADKNGKPPATAL